MAGGCEYINASRKMQAFGLDYAAAIQNIRDLQLIWRFVLPTPNVLERAVKLIGSHSLSFWDAMIIAACAEAGVTKLYSEDLSMYPQVEGVKLINPFKT
jgi:predicted nucleic acid-binding protein